MNINTATFEDIPALYKLWESAFLADTDFLNLFFSKGFLLSQTYIYKTKGLIISALSVFKVWHQDKKGAYIYGVCTDKNHRGKKYAASLLQKTEEELRKKDYSFFILRPAEEELFAYYKSIGYKEVLFASQEKISLPILPSYIPTISLTAQKLYTLRKRNFGDDFIEWDIPSLEYIISFILNSNGDAVLFNDGTYLLGYPEDDCYKIIETSDTKRNLSLNYIKGKYPELNCTYIIDKANTLSKNAQPFVLYKGDLPQSTYFNLTME